MRLERLNMKYGAWIGRDRFTEYMRLKALLPFQLAVNGRGRAFGAWARCEALQPQRLRENVKHLVMIVIGYERQAKLDSVRRRIRYGKGQGSRRELVGNG
jgi:hypothetical protein